MGSLTKSNDDKRKQTTPPRPPLPKNIVISGPVPLSPIADDHKAVPIKRHVSKPSRPPPIANTTPKLDAASSEKPERPPRTPRPKSRDAVARWWKEVEYEKGSGFTGDGDVLEWFHG